VARRPVQPDGSWVFVAPLELRAHDLPSQAALGFHRGRTEELLNRAAATIERLSRDLAEIREARETWRRERDRLDEQLEEAKKRAELLVGEAMVDAHKAAQALKAEAEADAAEIRADADALLEPARDEAKRLVAEAHVQANQLIAAARAECERLAAEAEQYRLLAAGVQERSVAFLQRALEALGEGADSDAAGDGVAPFRTPDWQAADQIPEAAAE
jgi:cell division septum initiation protein DivIVA